MADGAVVLSQTANQDDVDPPRIDVRIDRIKADADDVYMALAFVTGPNVDSRPCTMT